MFGTGVDEVHESSPTIEFREKNGGVGLRFRTLDPLKTRSNATVFTATFAKNTATVTTHTHFWLVERDFTF